MNTMMMGRSAENFQKTFEKLYLLSVNEKIIFLEELLFYSTLTGRGIWSDNKSTDTEKVEAFKWLNELCHRIWNIKFDLQHGDKKDSITRLYENMKFYGEQSELLREHLVQLTLGAFNNYIEKNRQSSTCGR